MYVCINMSIQNTEYHEIFRRYRRNGVDYEQSRASNNSDVLSYQITSDHIMSYYIIFYHIEQEQ